MFRPTPSRTLLICSAAFLAGILVHAALESVWLERGSLVAATVLAALTAAAVLADGHRRLACIAAILFLLAVLRYDAVLSSLENRPPVPSSFLRPPSALVIAPPQEYPDRTTLDIETESGARIRLTVRNVADSRYRYADVIDLDCDPKPVDRTVGGYDEYLYFKGIHATCTVYIPPSIRAEPTAVSPRFSDFRIPAAVHAFRHAVIRTVRDAYPEPDASLLLGLLIGDTSGLETPLKDDFRATGTSHILAVSGYNVIQVIRLAVILFAIAAVPRKATVIAAAAAVTAFAVLVGDDASVVRAAIMGSVMLLAELYGRAYSGIYALTAAAALMLAIEPTALRHDIGFALSFAAVIGLHVLAHPATDIARRIVRHRTAARLIGETAAATVVTLPILLAAFGSVPLVGILANLAVVPLVPFAMVGGAVSVAIAPFSAYIAAPLVVPTTLILRIIRLLTAATAHAAPWRIETSSMSAVVIAAAWTLMLVVVVAYRDRRRSPFDLYALD